VKKHGRHTYTACLICSEVVSALKEYSSGRNYETLHTHKFCVLEGQLEKINWRKRNAIYSSSSITYL